MQILITGVAGFIGFSLAKRLLESGLYTVLGVDKFDIQSYTPSSDDTATLQRKRLAQLFMFDRFNYSQQDLSCGMTLADTTMPQPNIIIHLAGMSGVRASAQAASQYVDANIRAFMNVLDAAKEAGIPKVFYASSSSVYGDRGHDTTPFAEHMQLGPSRSVYSTTKRTMELLAANLSNVPHYPQTLGLRFFSVYGPWGRPDMAPYKFASALYDTATNPVSVYGNGLMHRDFTYIRDVVESIFKLMHVRDEQLPPIVNIGTGNAATTAQLIVELSDYAPYGSPLHHKLVHLQKCDPQDVPYTRADTTLLTNTIGEHKFVSLADGVRLFAQWFLNNRKQ